MVFRILVPVSLRAAYEQTVSAVVIEGVGKAFLAFYDGDGQSGEPIFYLYMQELVSAHHHQFLPGDGNDGDDGEPHFLFPNPGSGAAPQPVAT